MATPLSAYNAAGLTPRPALHRGAIESGECGRGRGRFASQQAPAPLWSSRCAGGRAQHVAPLRLGTHLPRSGSGGQHGSSYNQSQRVQMLG